MSDTVHRGISLPSYSGEDATCPKCLSVRIKTMYREGAGCDDEFCSVCEAEHLLRVCDNCHYSWPEAPLDAAASPANPQ